MDATFKGDNEDGPYCVAQRFSQGEISREEVIETLGHWRYEPAAQTDGYDFLLIDVPGSFSEVTKAFTEGLLDADTYNEIIDAAEEQEDELDR